MDMIPSFLWNSVRHVIAIPKRALSGPGAFRLILASLVFVHHTSRLAIGPAAVYLFFCLSGFWIYRMWNGRYSKTVNPYLTYLISRLWRLLPTFLLVSGLAIGIELAMGRTLSDLRGGGAGRTFSYRTLLSSVTTASATSRLCRPGRWISKSNIT